MSLEREKIRKRARLRYARNPELRKKKMDYLAEYNKRPYVLERRRAYGRKYYAEHIKGKNTKKVWVWNLRGE
jgi:hypothetical protein